jgi:ATP-dependent Clp protease ATP-binding subunit ClpA
VGFFLDHSVLLLGVFQNHLYILYPQSTHQYPTVKSNPKKGKKSALEDYTINLCEKAKAGGIDPHATCTNHCVDFINK